MRFCRSHESMRLCRSHDRMYSRIETVDSRDEEFLEVKEEEANEQQKSIIDALRAAAPK